MFFLIVVFVVVVQNVVGGGDHASVSINVHVGAGIDVSMNAWDTVVAPIAAATVLTVAITDSDVVWKQVLGTSSLAFKFLAVAVFVVPRGIPVQKSKFFKEAITIPASTSQRKPPEA